MICLSVIVTLFSSAFTKVYRQLLRMDIQMEEMKKKSDSLIFISESFFNTCQGKGFSSFEEWKSGCGSLWQLESIEWECVGTKNLKSEEVKSEEVKSKICESEENEKKSLLYCGRWKGPYGSGEVYGRKAKE